ncbi:MAG: cyclase family protein [Actinobacteria bacterium]|nr:cyclase family protein [Actinomycetota bacterium]
MPVRTLRGLAACAAAAALAVSAAACGASSSTPSSSASPSPTAAAGATTITYSRVVDLQHVISPDIPLWPGDPKIVFNTVATMKEDGYYLRSFTIGEHSATHMNAPNSFIAGDKRSITSYEAEQLVVPAAVIDVREQCAGDPDYQLSKQDVFDWEAVNGQLAPGTFLIMYTGWQDKWNDPTAFFNIDGKGNLHFPGFAGDTTTWLLSDRQVAGVGIEGRTRSSSSAWGTWISCRPPGRRWYWASCASRRVRARRSASWRSCPERSPPARYCREVR